MLKNIRFDELKKTVQKNNDTLYVVNFWATWCKPCVKELPHFYKSAHENLSHKTTFVFVSLDFPRNFEKVNKFLLDNSSFGKQYLLTDTDANEWIDQINPSWEGNIPATWLVKNSSTIYFTSQEITEQELKTLLHHNLQNQ